MSEPGSSRARRGGKAIVREALDRTCDFVIRQQHRRPRGGSDDGQLGEALELYGPPYRLGDVATCRDHAVVAEQHGMTRPEMFDDQVRQGLRAERHVGRATDAGAAECRDHVVHRWDVAMLRRQHRGVERMGVHDGADVDAVAVDVAMQPPFARRLVGSGPRRRLPVASERHRRHHLRIGLLGRNAGGRDQHRFAVAHRDVARGALVEAEADEVAAGVDEGGAKMSGHGRAFLTEGFAAEERDLLENRHG